MTGGVTLKDAVRAVCAMHELPFDDICKVERNHETDPTVVKVWFTGLSEPLVIEIERPTN